MREYIIKVTMPDEFIEEGQTTESDLKAIKNGDLPIDELVDWGQQGENGFRIEYEVRDI